MIDQNSFPDLIDTRIHNFDSENNRCMNLVDEYPTSLKKNENRFYYVFWVGIHVSSRSLQIILFGI